MTISLSNTTVLGAKPFVPGALATAGYQLTSGGDVKKDVNGTFTNIGDWISPKSGMSGYECRFTVTSGSVSWGVTGAWLDLANTNDFGVNETVAGSVSAVVTVEIRDKATHVVQASASITVTATLLH